MRLANTIKNVANNALREFEEKPISSTGVLVAILLVVIPAVLSSNVRGFLLSLLQAVFAKTIEASIAPLIFALAALSLALLNTNKVRKPKINFEIYDGFAWKYWVNKDGDIEFCQSPYCVTHKIKYEHRYKDDWVCIKCGADKVMNKTKYEIDTMRNMVQHMVAAQHDGHLK